MLEMGEPDAGYKRLDVTGREIRRRQHRQTEKQRGWETATRGCYPVGSE
jgi:hypothetical protein